MKEVGKWVWPSQSRTGALYMQGSFNPLGENSQRARSRWPRCECQCPVMFPRVHFGFQIVRLGDEYFPSREHSHLLLCC